MIQKFIINPKSSLRHMSVAEQKRTHALLREIEDLSEDLEPPVESFTSDLSTLIDSIQDAITSAQRMGIGDNDMSTLVMLNSMVPELVAMRGRIGDTNDSPALNSIIATESASGPASPKRLDLSKVEFGNAPNVGGNSSAIALEEELRESLIANSINLRHVHFEEPA